MPPSVNVLHASINKKQPSEYGPEHNRSISMETTRFLPVTLPNGNTVHVEATVLPSEYDVAGQDFDFGDISAPLEELQKLYQAP